MYATCLPQWIAVDFTALRVKVKAITLKAWTSPYGSRRLRLPDF
jgi:hypothetical protein